MPEQPAERIATETSTCFSSSCSQQLPFACSAIGRIARLSQQQFVRHISAETHPQR